MAYVDNNLTDKPKFTVDASLQKHRADVIQNLGKMIEQTLEKLKINSNLKEPLRIVLYRNGLSQGRYEHVSFVMHNI